MNFSSIVSMAESFTKLADAGESAKSIFDEITSSTGSDAILSALSTIDQDINHGFKSVVDAINNQTLIGEWEPYGSSLQYISTQTANYVTVLSSCQKLQDGPFPNRYTVNSDSKIILFEDWCADNALNELASFIQTANVGPTQLYYSLSGMFTETEGSPSVLQLWSLLIEKAAKTKSTVLGQFRTTTEFETTYKFMEYIFMTISAVYYAHDAALKLLLKIDPKAPFVSIASDINTNFGSVNKADSVWKLFADNLNTLRTTQTKPLTVDNQIQNVLIPVTQKIKAAATCDEYIGDIDKYSKSSWDWYASNQFTTKDAGLENAYFSSLQIVQIQNPTTYQYSDNWPVYILQAIPVTVGANMVLTPQDIYPSENSSLFTDTSNWTTLTTGTDKGINTLKGSVTVSRSSIDTPHNFTNLLYAVEPQTPTSNNKMNVVTGFRFCLIGNRLGLALQFGILDVSNPSSPTIKVADPDFKESVWCGTGENVSDSYMDYPEYIDYRPAGAYRKNKNGDAVNNYGIITNASLALTYGNRLGLNVQLAAPLFEAGFFQPSDIPPVMKS